MEPQMVPGTGLSLRQKQFLAVVLREKYILENFYLTGGTALSSWYLHHRESDDLDFFTTRPFDKDLLTAKIKSHQTDLDCRAIIVDEDWGFLTFFLRYPDNSRFKADFNHYSTTQLQPGFTWKGLKIDSLYDIAVNKIHTIRTHPRERDYVDYYFIIKKTSWKLPKLLRDADKKFGLTTDITSVSRNFLKAAEITDFPQMLVPLDPKRMVAFYESAARKLKNQIFKP